MRRGFTVLEVLVALAIFAYSAVVLVSGYLNVLNGYARAREVMQSDEDIKFARASLFAQTDITLATQGADFETIDGRHVVWTADIEPTTTADLFEVTFTCVVTPTAGEAVTTTETIRLLRPTWAGSEETQLQNDARQRIRDLNAANQTP